MSVLSRLIVIGSFSVLSSFAEAQHFQMPLQTTSGGANMQSQLSSLTGLQQFNSSGQPNPLINTPTMQPRPPIGTGRVGIASLQSQLAQLNNTLGNSINAANISPTAQSGQAETGTGTGSQMSAETAWKTLFNNFTNSLPSNASRTAWSQLLSGLETFSKPFASTLQQVTHSSNEQAAPTTEAVQAQSTPNTLAASGFTSRRLNQLSSLPGSGSGPSPSVASNQRTSAIPNVANIASSTPVANQSPLPGPAPNSNQAQTTPSPSPTSPVSNPMTAQTTVLSTSAPNAAANTPSLTTSITTNPTSPAQSPSPQSSPMQQTSIEQISIPTSSTQISVSTPSSISAGPLSSPGSAPITNQQQPQPQRNQPPSSGPGNGNALRPNQEATIPTVPISSGANSGAGPNSNPGQPGQQPNSIGQQPQQPQIQQIGNQQIQPSAIANTNTPPQQPDQPQTSQTQSQTPASPAPSPVSAPQSQSQNNPQMPGPN